MMKRTNNNFKEINYNIPKDKWCYYSGMPNVEWWDQSEELEKS
jgi:hypothetical protein